MRGRDEFNLQEAFELARESIRSLMLINGGGAAAVLSFFGSFAANHSKAKLDPSLVFDGLIAFCFGLAIATFLSIIGYMIQTRWGAELPPHVTDEREFNRHTQNMNVIAVWLSLFSLLAFITGVVFVAMAFRAT